ncbi:hypothetical protein ACW2Q0_28165 [Nocardia sp. R16R-3T]
MTSPDFPGAPLPARTYTASTVFALQNETQEGQATAANAELQVIAEEARQAFFTVIYSEVQQIPIIGGLIGDIIEIITGVEDGDLNDLGTWVNNLGNLVNAFIAAALHALADLLEFVPLVGGTLAEIIDNLADGMNSSHSTAVTANNTANTANTTANTANTNASTALSTANTANTTASAASTAASNAASVAAAAQETADIAYGWAAYREKEFAVTSSGLQSGNNETVLGITMIVPPDSIIKLTRLVYSMKSNTGTLTVQLIRRALNGTETVVWTTNIASAAITFPDNGIDYQIEDLDHFFCNITAISGVVTALHCCVEYVILPAP